MNIQSAMQFLQQVRNPQQFLQGMGIPKEHLKDPHSAEEYLLNNSRVTQQQIDQAKNMYRQIFGR